MKKISSLHTPVLVEECLSLLEGRSLATFVDGTLGMGGHAERILKEHPECSLFLGVDRDPQALELARTRLAPFGGSVQTLLGNMRELTEHLRRVGMHQASGILLDLGCSSLQIDSSARGFSFQGDGPLDMRMDSTQLLTAQKIVEEWTEEELEGIFREYGEMKNAKRVAERLVALRKGRGIQRTGELTSLLAPFLKPSRRGQNPLAPLFQALRIAVNDELGALQSALPQAIDLLEPGGRLLVITFHSLEDRIVKRGFQEAASQWQEAPQDPFQGRLKKEPLVKLLTKHPLTPGLRERRQNPRSRSAKLRAVEKL